MSNGENENIITNINNGKNIRRDVDYNNKKPILLCFNGKAYRLKDIIKGLLLNSMKIKKGQDFYENILKIRTSVRGLFSKSPDEIFNLELIESVYTEKTKYESASTNYIIELCLAILEQFGYSKEELKILFADEKRPYNVDIKSLEPIVWGESGEEYIWDLNDFPGIHYSYLKIPDTYNLYNKIPKLSVINQEMIAIDYKDGEIIDIHTQASHRGELRIPKKIFKKHGISVDSIIESGKQFQVRVGFLYPNIRNYLIIIDFQEAEEEAKKKAEEDAKKKAEEDAKNKIYNLTWKNLKQKDVEYRKQIEYNEIWKVSRQGSIEEIKKRKIEEKNQVLSNKIKELEEENKGLKEEIIKNKDICSNKIKELEEENKGLKEEIIKNKNICSNKIKELEEKNEIKELEEKNEIKAESKKISTKEKVKIINIEHHKHDTVVDNIITGAALRTNIFEIISGLSKENKKCNNMILVNNFYKKGYQNYEIYSALNLMEKENIIYKIVYVDWFIKEKYRDNEIDSTDKLWIDVFNIIKNFSKKYNWNYGIKRSDLYDELLKKDHLEVDIGLALESMKNQDIIYNKTYIYWFTNEYKGHIKEEITEEDAVEEDIIEFPSKESKIEIDNKIQEKDLQIDMLKRKIEELETENFKRKDIEQKIGELRSAENRFDSAKKDFIKYGQDLYNKVTIPGAYQAYTLHCKMISGIDAIEELKRITDSVGLPFEIRKVVIREKKA